MLRVLDSMSFHKFIEERGPPFRSSDIFDEVNDRQRDKEKNDLILALCLDLRSIETGNRCQFESSHC